jgi:hypothetical protein
MNIHKQFAKANAAKARARKRRIFIKGDMVNTTCPLPTSISHQLQILNFHHLFQNISLLQLQFHLIKMINEFLLPNECHWQI